MADEEFKKAFEARREIEFTVTGRTSGREISNPVSFVRDGEKLNLLPVRGSVVCQPGLARACSGDLAPGLEPTRAPGSRSRRFTLPHG
jgi:hypothetical protein